MFWTGFPLRLTPLTYNRVPFWWQEVITHGISGKGTFPLKNGFWKTHLFSIGLKKTIDWKGLSIWNPGLRSGALTEFSSISVPLKWRRFPKHYLDSYHFFHFLPLPTTQPQTHASQLTPIQAAKAVQRLPAHGSPIPGKKKKIKKNLQDAKNGFVSQRKRNIFHHHNEIFINSRH